MEPLEARLLLSGFTAYNDAVAGALTHVNATTYADNGGTAAGLLKDISTGANTTVTLLTTNVGGNFGGTGSNPAGGDAYAIFNGYVDFTSTAGNNSIEIDGADEYTYDFSDLDVGGTYDFTGTAVRGNSGYTRRWTLVTIEGADSYTPAHSSAVGIYTTGLQPNQVAIWTGANHLSTQGWVVRWTDIDPGLDGEFAIVCTQYTGAIPTSVDASGVANDIKGYALNGVRLMAVTPSAPPVVANSAATSVEAFGAIVNGTVVSTGGEAPHVLMFFGNEDGGTSPGAWDMAMDLGIHSGAFAAQVGGLIQNTPYYYRAFAFNSMGEVWTPSTATFTTLAASAPSIINLPAADVGAYSARLFGQVTDTGNDTPLVTLYYGTTNGGTTPGAWDHSVNVGVQGGTFSSLVTDLDPEQTYYFTARARNAIGDTWAAPARTFATTAAPSLIITEFLADNGDSYSTRTRASTAVPFAGDLKYLDWIEIHNPSDAPVAIGGYRLTDDVTKSGWAFPAGTVIPAGGYIVVFASGTSITNPALDERGWMHADFKLSDSGGEDVALLSPDGVIVGAYLDYPVQNEDISYGIGADGLERYFPAPTPGWDNANAYPRSPVFSAGSRTFTGSMVLTLTAAYPTDVIRYTLDETTPTAASPVYTGPITITGTTMVRAVSIGADGKSSVIVGNSYVRLGSDVLAANSNLPYVIVDTFGDGVPGPTGGFGDVFIAIFEPGTDGRSNLTSNMTLTTRAGIHIRGSSSAGFYKKQYRVEFWDEYNEDRRIEVLGMPAEADWIFYGPGPYDRNLMSNPLMYDLSNQTGQYAVRCQYVEMYLNANGGDVTAADYVGLYVIMEVIESGDDRLDIDGLSTGAGGVPVSGGFIWKNDRGSPYVEPELPTTAQSIYINSWINGLENAALSTNFRDPVLGYAAWAEVATFIDHNMLNMLAMNVDALRLSGYYYKDTDTKLMAGPIWDFDRSLDSTDGRDDNSRWWYGTGDSTRYFDDDAVYGDRSQYWWSRMFDDPDFVTAYIDRWFELRKTVFSLDNIYATINAHAAQITEAAARDYARWSASRYTNFAGEVNHLKDWLNNRIAWIDSQWLKAPTVSVAAEVVAPGTNVTFSAPVGSIVYYTLDGTDPRLRGGGVSPSAVQATGPVTVNAYTNITARVYYAGYTPSYGQPGYVPTGDDWGTVLRREYFVNPLAGPGDLVITEINYHPFDPTPAELAGQPVGATPFDKNDFEFVELMNVSGHALNIRSVRFTNGVDFEFPSFVLAPGGRIVVAANADAFIARYGVGGSLAGTGIVLAGTYSGKLDNSGERLALAARNAAVMLDFAYGDSGAWPGRADGLGAALELEDPWAVPASEPARQTYLETGANWNSSVRYGGSPGAADHAAIPVVVNEVLTHTDQPLVDSIELYNTSATETFDLGGWWLSDSWGWDTSPENGDYRKFRIPDGTILGPGEYLVFYQGHYAGSTLVFAEGEFGYGPKGFALNSYNGDDVWLMKADPATGSLTAFVDHVEFQAAANGESFGRWPNGAGVLWPMTDLTLPGPNSGPRVGPLIISEVHYNPAGGGDLEFIEITNPTNYTIDLWDRWTVGGVPQDVSWTVEGFSFPAGTSLDPGESLVVVGFDPADTTLLNAFKAAYGIDAGVLIVGPFDGRLDNAGETIRIERPDEPPMENPTLIPWLLVDEVNYDNESPWPFDPTGAQSLNRAGAGAWGIDPASWLLASPTPGAADLTVPPPVVTGIVFNELYYPAQGTSREGLPVSGIEGSGIGVRFIDVMFSEQVVFAAADVLVQTVTFSGNVVNVTGTLSPTVTGTGTAAMRIELPVATVKNTWVLVVLADTITSVAGGMALDGEATGSGRGYIYVSADMPTGNGEAGGAARFFLGSLVGDLWGPSSRSPAPEGAITRWDITAFTAAYQSGSLSADLWGASSRTPTPEGLISRWDVTAFTAAYQSPGSLAPLPTLLGPLSGGEPVALVDEGAPLAPLAPLSQPQALADALREPQALPAVASALRHESVLDHGWASQPWHTAPTPIETTMGQVLAAARPTRGELEANGWEAASPLARRRSLTVAARSRPAHRANPRSEIRNLQSQDDVDLLAVPALDVIL
jgi:hypothetical protein